MYVVWSNQLGAAEQHVASAAQLMLDPRVRHYWDGNDLAGSAFRPRFPGLSFPAWDVWMLFAPDATWDGVDPPAPSWWEHQLGVLQSSYPDRHLDATRFARKARELAADAGRRQR